MLVQTMSEAQLMLHCSILICMSTEYSTQWHEGDQLTILPDTQ